MEDKNLNNKKQGYKAVVQAPAPSFTSGKKPNKPTKKK